MTRQAVAIVTGGASGIGQAIAARLRVDGFTVVAFDLRDTAVDDEPGVVADVSDAEAVDAAVREVLDRYGRIDLLVNGAGITGSRDATTCHQTTVAEWDRVLAVNLRAPFLCARAVLPTMLDQGSGHIITIVSVAGLAATPGRAAYTASKGGALLLTKSLAADYAGRGIRANAVCPGFVQTPMTQWRLDVPELRADVLRNIPTGTITQPEEIAEAVALLCSDRLPSLTGQAFVVDGGWTSTLGTARADTALDGAGG